MVANELINNSIMAMEESFTPLEVLSWMEEYKLSHLPVVRGKEFLGLLSESTIFALDDLDKPLNEQHSALNPVSILPAQHIFEVMKMMAEDKLTALPVADNQGIYRGLITGDKIIERFSALSSVQQPGGIIILEMNTRDYFASQLVKLVEENDARLLSLYVESMEDTTKMKVTIKLNTTEIQQVIRTLERFGYKVAASYYENESDDLRDRYDSLMNYLSI